MSTDSREDPLARTATAPGSSAPGSTPAAPLGASLGRYRLERELGAGGMGVVHAAFDPDLERRVALKVLRSDDGAGDARQRLLREARAMARLTHANVVTVHEVGSASGRDYVAMELIDGETLADWLKSARRSPAEIVAAFLAAGRGLAAAHAAGLVHRDFKPHNVLRRRDGRIVVTDFGLARGVETTVAECALETTLPVGSSQNTPSPLSGITATGSVLGTPAYMAPEQWEGGVVGPAADQFGFCVAMWEALTGARPFRGATIEALKEEVGRGPADLDASKLPRRLRDPLRRGLDPEPGKRWPSMDALLAALVRAERRPQLAFAIGAGAIALAAVAYAILSRGHEPACAPAALDVAQVWPTDRAAALTTTQPLAAQAIAADVEHWQQARARACRADVAAREPRLACLDGVLGRLDAVARAAATLHDPVRVDAGALLIDPAVCEAARPPRLARTSSAELRDVLATSLHWNSSVLTVDNAAAEALVARAAPDPCAAALAHGFAAGAQRADRQRHLDEADAAAQSCGDDRVIAEVAIVCADHALEGGFLGPEVTAKIKRAAALVAKVAQPDLVAEIDLLRMQVAIRGGHLDDALADADTAITGFSARGRFRAALATDLEALRLRTIRGKPDELAGITKRFAELRARATQRLGADDDVVHKLDSAAAWWMFEQGDVMGAHARFESLRRPLPNEAPKRITGRVVDEHGAPVTGAFVATAPQLSGDSVSAALALPGPRSDHLRTTSTRADGTFAIADAAEDGVIIAQLGDRRSPPMAVADGLTLALAPTSRLEGKVDLRGEPTTNVIIVVTDQAKPVTLPYQLLAPLQPDGSFVVDAAPRGRVKIASVVERPTGSLTSGTELAVPGPVVRGIQLGVASSSKRTLHVLVRSTVGVAVANAQVIVLPGRVESSNALAMSRSISSASIGLARQIDGEHAPAAVIAKAKPGDLFATIEGIPDGVASACAVSLPADLADPDLQRKVFDHMDKLEVRCVPVAPGDEAVTIEVPPWPRFD